jgi:bromodomain-containing factor 1
VVKKTKAAKPAKKQAPTKKAAPAATKKSGTARAKYMGTHEKNVISLGISRLPEDIIKEILAMIKSETDVDVSVYECSTLIELTPL